jgi:hypothetical protein
MTSAMGLSLVMPRPAPSSNPVCSMPSCFNLLWTRFVDQIRLQPSLLNAFLLQSTLNSICRPNPRRRRSTFNSICRPNPRRRGSTLNSIYRPNPTFFAGGESFLPPPKATPPPPKHVMC